MRVEKGEEDAWNLYIERLAECLDHACALGKARATDAGADQQFGQLLCDVFSVNHYVDEPI
jgi:hypothetical protein